MARFDLSTPAGRLRAYLDYLVQDHAYLRLGFENAHWVSPELVRANQPWPFQLRWWRDRGIRTVINLRGGGHATGFYELEKDACARLGLTLVDFPVSSREAPTRDQVEGAKALFETVQYPAVMHCKSGADRAGLMGVLYAHFRLGLPIREALKELSLRHLHVRHGKTGVIDYAFERYLAQGEPTGLSFLQWVQRPDYDPKAIKAEFQAAWWGTLLTEKLLRRE
ncbi:MAG TPA: sulfur transferase domain-containing protein [Caulobacteraceae bacterium]|nr:sulfur transferase domain-containing protein [Caulobacteraceae bacterium]